MNIWCRHLEVYEVERELSKTIKQESDLFDIFFDELSDVAADAMIHAKKKRVHRGRTHFDVLLDISVVESYIF